jgi:penicillin-binding protein 2
MIPRPRWSRRLVGLALAVAVAIATLTFELAHLQIAENGTLRGLAEANRVHRLLLDAERGVVYDRHGVQLAFNQPAWTLVVVPAALPRDATRRAAELRRIAQLSGRPESEVTEAVRSAPDPYVPLTLKQNLDQKEAQLFAERLPELPGVKLELRPIRSYPDPGSFSHILGYTGRINADEYARVKPLGYQPDQVIGKAGVEAGLETLLRGHDGWAEVETDSRGQVVRTLREHPSQPGTSVFLSIDANFQKVVTGYVAEGAAKVHRKAAAAVVVDPRTGEVLALASVPGYDNNLFTGGISQADFTRLANDPAQPLYDRAIAGQYPPGSTFKMITASAGLQTGQISPDTRLGCPGAVQFGGWVYHNWTYADLGPMNVTKAIGTSCDTFFYVLATMVGDETLASFAKAFGYGEVPGIELPGAAPGVAPDSDWLADQCAHGLAPCGWGIGDTATMGIGQSYVLTTPLIQAMYVSAVANAGQRLRPTLVHEARDAAGHTVLRSKPEVVEQLPLSPANLEVVKRAMGECLTGYYHTGDPWRQIKFQYDGGCKTGTAQYGGSGTDLPAHSWYVFFAPYQNSEIAIVTFVEGGGEGFQAAEPIAVKIGQYYFDHRAEIRAR